MHYEETETKPNALTLEDWKKPSGFLSLFESFFPGRHLKELNRHILSIHRARTMEELVSITAKILKSIVSYKLFAFVLKTPSGLEIWSDPLLSKQRLLDLVNSDFEGSGIENLSYIKSDKGNVIETFFYKPESVTSTMLHVEETKACMYMVHGTTRLFTKRKSAGIVVEAFENALSNLLKIRNLEHASSIDPLTGCYNRRSLKNLLERSMDNAKRYKRDLSVIMLDVDHFKAINDSYGHLFGDSVLKTIASSLEHFIRKGDYIARYGGEEFLVVLPETSLNTAVDIAHRLKNRIEGLSMTSPCGRQVLVTASYGVASMRPEDNMEFLLSEADTMLYLAKTNGRNRVMSTGL
jgi:diguanylate cyclase (GGDEF)-like protein